MKSLEPTFGAVNLEDIKAPECFYIEETLQKKMSVPVFHDDQHGTAIIASAAFLNALEITKRNIKKAKIVFNGAGAAAVGCIRMFLLLGVRKENILVCDRKGVIHSGRTDLSSTKKDLAQKTQCRTLEDAVKNADVFVGVSVANILSPTMLKTMAKDPIVFALANPDPEIDPILAKSTRSDVIIATGRSDYPNQVNNVLGFPYLFRGALDVQATQINDEMKLAATAAIAKLAKEFIPEQVLSVYKHSNPQTFGRDYLIPKPVDQRVLLRVAPAVAKAAMESGVAGKNIDLESYQDHIANLLGPTQKLIRSIRIDIAHIIAERKNLAPNVVIPHGEHPNVLLAAKEVLEDGLISLTLLGDPRKLEEELQGLSDGARSRVTIINPKTDPLSEEFSKSIYNKRKRKGVNKLAAEEKSRNHNYFAASLLLSGKVDALLTGVSHDYVRSVKPLIEIIGVKKDHVLTGIYLMVKDNSLKFFADCTINIEPSEKELANIASVTADFAQKFTSDPIRVALLSYANFGTSKHPSSKIITKARELVQKGKPDFEIDGGMQVDAALNSKLREKEFSFSKLTGDANVLIFPNLSSANIGYKLLTNMGDVASTGPILLGLKKTANVLHQEASVQEIVNMIYVSAHESLSDQKKEKGTNDKPTDN